MAKLMTNALMTAPSTMSLYEVLVVRAYMALYKELYTMASEQASESPDHLLTPVISRIVLYL
jgi:hypothetical protein